MTIHNITIDLKDCLAENLSLKIQLDLTRKEVFTQSTFDELINDCKGIGYVLAVVPTLIKKVFFPLL